jgi:Domain of unknown function (DUF4340)
MKKGPLIALVFALALGAFVYFYEIKGERERDEGVTTKPAFTFKSEDVVSMNIVSKGQTVALENDGKNWTISQPVKTEADSMVVEGIVSAIASTTIDRSLASNENLLRGSGLDQPAATINFKLKNGEQHSISLGKKDPTEANLYGKIDQNPGILLLPASLETAAIKGLNDLRSKQLSKISLPELQKISVKNSNGTFTAEQSPESKWILQEPADKKGNEAKADKLSSILTTSATEIIDQPDAKLISLTAKSAAEITLTTKDNKTTKIFISPAEKEDAYVKVEGKSELYKISKSVLDSYTFKLADLVSEPPPSVTNAPEKAEPKPPGMPK